MASSQGYRGYQGYPYVNPVVTDVPTVDPATASRWANLPRRPIGQAPGQNWTRPSPGGSGTSSSQDTQQHQEPKPSPPEDLDVVVYIDLPEGGSGVSQSFESPIQEEPRFIENTILYDPFDNRRINSPKLEGNEEDSGKFKPAVRPIVQDLNSPSGSNYSGPSSSNSQPKNIPGFSSKESQIYGGEGPDGFPISPIPISEFPEPPPAYSETPVPKPPIQMEIREEPPRTQVILPGHNSPSTIPYVNRKNLTCHHCGVMVHTVVIRESGFMTHFMAGFFCILLMPLVPLVYLCNCFKYKNHYCPNCNRIIANQLPFCSDQINYVIN